jgi:hypothetical protein
LTDAVETVQDEVEQQNTALNRMVIEQAELRRNHRQLFDHNTELNQGQEVHLDMLNHLDYRIDRIFADISDRQDRISLGQTMSSLGGGTNAMSIMAIQMQESMWSQFRQELIAHDDCIASLERRFTEMHVNMARFHHQHHAPRVMPASFNENIVNGINSRLQSLENATQVLQSRHVQQQRRIAALETAPVQQVMRTNSYFQKGLTVMCFRKHTCSTSLDNMFRRL